MKTFILLMLIGFSASAQSVAINNTGASAATSAILDVSSTDKGTLFPRMTSTQRTGIASPVAGLLVYQTNSPSGFYYYTGTAWVSLGSIATKYIGTDTSDSGTPGGVFVINRTLTSEIDASGHGFVDNTIFKRPNRAYASFDAHGVVPTNFSSNLDHWVDFQSRATINGTGVINYLYGFYSELTRNNGNSRWAYGLKTPAFDGTGSIDSSYGVWVTNLSLGTFKRGLRVDGNMISSFGGDMCIGCSLTYVPNYNLDVTGTIGASSRITGNTLKTSQPSSNGAGEMKIGKIISTTGLTLDGTKYLEVDIDGVVYKLAIVQ